MNSQKKFKFQNRKIIISKANNNKYNFYNNKVKIKKKVSKNYLIRNKFLNKSNRFLRNRQQNSMMII